MTLRYKEDALEQIRDRQSPGEMRADRRTSILEAYRRTNDISLDEALLNALDLGIEHMAQRDRRRGVNKVAALGVENVGVLLFKNIFTIAPEALELFSFPAYRIRRNKL